MGAASVEFSDTEVLVDGVPVLQIHGEIDLASSVRLRRRLESIIEQGPLVVVDLTEVSFFDSSGLKIFDEVQTKARQDDVRMVLVCPPGRTLRLFEITGLLDHFSIHDTVERAADPAATDA